MYKCKFYSMDKNIDEKVFFVEDISFALCLAAIFDEELYVYCNSLNCWITYDYYINNIERKN